MAGYDVIANMAASALQGRGEAVADDDRAQIVRPINEPPLGHRDPTAPGWRGAERRSRRSPRPPPPASRWATPFCDGGLGLALEVGVPDGAGRQDQARHGATIAFADGDREAEHRHASPVSRPPHGRAGYRVLAPRRPGPGRCRPTKARPQLLDQNLDGWTGRCRPRPSMPAAGGSRRVVGLRPWRIPPDQDRLKSSNRSVLRVFRQSPEVIC